MGQTGHKSDIYVSVQSSELQAAPKKELGVAYKLLGKVLKDFFAVNDTFSSANGQEDDNVFIPSSMDASTHFEQTTQEVMKIYKEITGQDVDLNANPESLGDDQ